MGNVEYTTVKNFVKLLTVLGLMLLTAPVFAGSADDLHKQQFDETWSSLRTFPLMHPTEPPIGVYLENESPLYKSGFAQDVTDSLDAWRSALGGRLRYFLTPNPAKAQIRMHWVPDFPEPYQAGETDIQIGESVITIKVNDIPENIIRQNIMHELGHALGILDHSPMNQDIMVAFRGWSSHKDYSGFQAALSDPDNRAMNRLYGPDWIQGEDLYRVIYFNGKVYHLNKSGFLADLQRHDAFASKP
jgi:hypothetical protein